MSGFYLRVKSTNSRIRTYFNPPIELGDGQKYEMALVGLETYHSFPNITSANNVFRYSPNNGTQSYTIYVPEGSYEINEINDYIQAEMKKQVGNLYKSDGVVIGTNLSTLRSTLKFAKRTDTTQYWVDFSVNNSLGSVLGFNKGEYAYVEKKEDPIDPDKVTSYTDYYESENIVRIDEVSEIRITNDIIGASYLDGEATNDTYSFYPEVAPGYKIVEKPLHLIYLPIVVQKIFTMETQIVDQNGRLMNFRGEDIIIRFHIRERMSNILYDAFSNAF